MLIMVRNLVWTGISQLVLVSLILDKNQPPRSGDISMRPSLNLSLSMEIGCSMKSGSEICHGIGFCIFTVLYPSQLSLPGQARGSIFYALLTWADWPVSSCLPLQIRDRKCFSLGGTTLGCESWYMPKSHRITYLWDCCLWQMGLKVIGGLKNSKLGHWDKVVPLHTTAINSL